MPDLTSPCRRPQNQRDSRTGSRGYLRTDCQIRNEIFLELKNLAKKFTYIPMFGIGPISVAFLSEAQPTQIISFS